MKAAPLRSAITGLGALACLAACGAGSTEPTAVTPSAIGQVIRLSGELDAVLSPNAVVEEVARGFYWAEGPAWSGADGVLYLTDTGREAIFAWSETGGLSQLSPPAPLAGARAIGLAAAADGRLLYADARNGLGAWDRAAGTATVLAEGYEGAPFNGLNDVAAAADGTIYFTDHGSTDADGPQAVNGVYALAPTGEITLLSGALDHPNGVAVSPADGAVHVVNSLEGRPVILRIDPNGGGEEVIFDARDAGAVEGGATLDGLAVDFAGRLFVASGAGVWVVSEGEAIGRIDLGRPVSNVTIVGDVLYITASDILARVRLGAE